MENRTSGRKVKRHQLIRKDRLDELIEELYQVTEPKNKLGYGLQLFTNKLGISHSSFNRVYYQKNGDFSIDMLIKICDYFGVSLDWLMGRSDFKKVMRG